MQIQKYRTLLLLLLLYSGFGSIVFGQSSPESGRFNYQAGFETSISRIEGDAPDWVRQNASDFSTNYGTSASYKRIWSPSFAVYGLTSMEIASIFRADLGLRLGTFGTKEQSLISYDPPNGLGLTSSTREITNTYFNASPNLMLRASYMRISLCLGVEANIFLAGKTREYTAYTSLSTSEETTSETLLDTQDQPVYLDPSAVGGVVDYTSATNRNHGANPIWFAGIGKVEYKLLNRKGSPMIGVSWRLPLSEIIRSQNPKWSFIRGVDTELIKLNYGAKISTASVHLGWAF